MVQQMWNPSGFYLLWAFGPRAESENNCSEVHLVLFGSPSGFIRILFLSVVLSQSINSRSSPKWNILCPCMCVCVKQARTFDKSCAPGSWHVLREPAVYHSACECADLSRKAHKGSPTGFFQWFDRASWRKKKGEADPGCRLSFRRPVPPPPRSPEEPAIKKVKQAMGVN